MKRLLKRDHYRLSDWEKNEIWRAVSGDPGGRSPRRRAFAPAFAFSLTAAAACLVLVWWAGLHEPAVPETARGPQPESRVAPGVAERPARVSGEVTGSTAEAADRKAAPRTQVAADAAAPGLSRETEKSVARTAPPKVAVGGRVYDKASGEALSQAAVTLAGTNRGVVSDRNGLFRIDGVAPGDSVALEIRYLGYDPVKVTVAAPDTGLGTVDVAMASTIVATLQPFEVEGAEYMVDVKSLVDEQTISSETFQKYAMREKDDALSKQVGRTLRAGQLYVRGGRSGDVAYEVQPAPGTPAAQTAPRAGEPQALGMRRQAGGKLVVPRDSSLPPGSVTGGTTPPNGEKFELMYFSHEGVNPFVATEDDALSTFAVDVDNGSWTLCRNYLERGALPPPDAVRVEEFVNAVDPGYAAQSDRTLVIHADGAPSRFGKGYQLLRVGLAGMVIDASERKPANLVFVVDVSGSMERENRLGAVRWALTMLLDQLQEGDRVGLVVYGSRGEVRLEPTGIDQREKIKAAIAGLRPNGSTNCYDGLKLAYAMARRTYEAGRINRLILCSDGVANNGAATRAEEILTLVRESTDAGITLSTVGFGMGNYNDALMEKLADKGDGNYAYVDRKDEAERVFKENLTGTLQTIARQAKVQVEFDPEKVDRWRLLGYENRDVADRDFRNDDVDAGEIGAGHRVTALYEIKLKGKARGRLGTVRLRWEAPAHDTAHAGEVTEIERPIEAKDLAKAFADGDIHFKVQAVAAEFAEILRHSYWAKESELADLAVVADAVADEARGTEKLADQAADLARLIRQAARLKADEDARLDREGGK